ncbi:MAG: hypothetical protein BroJett004_18440 [Planctomycetota bacterium]|nr:MAG: hypothetical protein BroJett004_18440 [Planctomycetota bacterium]
MKREVGANWKRATFIAALTTIVTSVLSQPQQPCYKPKEPTGCADCGRSQSYMYYCEQGCESGSPGRTGPGTLTQFYCYMIPSGGHATWACNDPVPQGWTFTGCSPNGDGLCCIMKNGADPNPTENVLSTNACYTGGTCGSGGGEQ